MLKVHETAAEALADSTPGAKITRTFEECAKLTGRPGVSAEGRPGWFSTPLECAVGWVAGVTSGRADGTDGLGRPYPDGLLADLESIRSKRAARQA